MALNMPQVSLGGTISVLVEKCPGKPWVWIRGGEAHDRGQSSLTLGRNRALGI